MSTGTETTFRVERGINDRDGQFVVMKIRRGFCRNGEVAFVSREKQTWWPSEAEATAERARLEAQRDDDALQHSTQTEALQGGAA